MEDFLRKIKLIDDMSTRLNVTTPEFVSALRKDVEESDIDNIFSGLFEAFSSDKRKYKGMVDSRGFYIRKGRKLFGKKHGPIKAEGTFRTSGDILVVNTVIKALSFNRLIFIGFVLVCYAAILSFQFESLDELKSLIANIPGLFPLLFILAMIGIPYFSLRKEVANMKKDLEQQFYSIASKVNN